MSESAGDLFDTSVWIGLAFPTHPHHRAAVEAFDQCSAAHPAVFCRATQQSFLRIATTPAILQLYDARSFTNRDAWAMLNRFLSVPAVSFRDEPSGIWPALEALATRETASCKLWMDAYLAAFAMCGGYRFVTMDQAFRQFKGLELQLLPTA